MTEATCYPYNGTPFEHLADRDMYEIVDGRRTGFEIVAGPNTLTRARDLSVRYVIARHEDRYWNIEYYHYTWDDLRKKDPEFGVVEVFTEDGENFTYGDEE